MKLVKLFLASAVLAVPSIAIAEDFEVITIYEGNSVGGTYQGVSIRSTLMEGDAGAAETAQTGLRARVDFSNATYETNYDATAGTGTSTTTRALLTYGTPVSNTSTITVGVGASNIAVSVSPDTASSPDDTTEVGLIYTAEFESTFEGGGRLHALIESGNVGATYTSATYQMAFDGWRIGPTANRVSDGEYSRTSFGVSAAIDLGEQLELGLSGAVASQQIGAAAATQHNIFGVYLRTAF